MRPRTARAWDRTLAGLSAGALLAAGIMWAAEADAQTTITGEGIFMPRGSTAKQFGGVFCQPTCTTVSSMPTSVRREAIKLDQAVMSSTGPTTVWGFSLTAVAVHQLVDEWTANPDTAPDPERVRIITTGNPLNPLGGTQRNRSNAVAIPEAQPYKHLDVVVAYDSVADRPARWGWYSQRELSLSRHLSYNDVDVDDPNNLVYQSGNTTHMLIPATELRQLRGLRFLRDIGWVTQERYDEVDAERRARIEADYNRPAYVPQGEGADWANGVEPEALRDEEESWSEDESDDRPEVESSSETERGGSFDQQEPRSELNTTLSSSKNSVSPTRTQKPSTESGRETDSKDDQDAPERDSEGGAE